MIKWIAAVAALVILMGYALFQLGAGGRLAAELNRQHRSEVVLYSASWCSACAATRQFLTDNRIPFVELDMEQDPQGSREFAQFGGHGIPLVLVRGRAIRGHQPRLLIQALSP
ncbi:glutaredoxin family protein [Ferrimonas sediminicola]|uniref:Glutaredoxin family protein n=1 Tax=Ferrimonas sediminicola TaxID=2569538 RepID=A0A4U1BAQ0_9GAMM|nr:glutaredoxin family protein [Ferrimonas sediminicola]TKB47935.1 glutaredoxin family protein [Ferrimonas sediminicola]